MAKAYITASKRIGSVGGETYSVVNGQTIVKAKPIAVANPRTTAQMAQRSLFLGGVRFYQHANQAFFKLAFEDKRQTESDYNAFMRTNAKLGVNLTKKMGDDPRFPALGNWICTKGSLASPAVTSQTTMYTLDIAAASSQVTTIGGLTPLIKEKYGLRELDIVTIVKITSSLKSVSSSTLEPVYVGSSAPSWDIRQFKLDSTSTEPLSNYGFDTLESGDDALTIRASSMTNAGACIISFSRNTASGLKVSTSTICNNDVASGIITQMQDAAFVEKVLATWDVSADAILQGSLS